jgi:hypothetical protein
MLILHLRYSDSTCRTFRIKVEHSQPLYNVNVTRSQIQCDNSVPELKIYKLHIKIKAFIDTISEYNSSPLRYAVRHSIITVMASVQEFVTLFVCMEKCLEESMWFI